MSETTIQFLNRMKLEDELVDKMDVLLEARPHDWEAGYWDRVCRVCARIENLNGSLQHTLCPGKRGRYVRQE
jgi:hypothetical protein